MKEESVKIYYLVPVSSSEENDKDVFIDFDRLDNLRRTLYVDAYKEAIRDAKIISGFLKQDVAVVELKEVVKFRPKRIQKVKKQEENK